jgi:hypothetical protein
VAAGCSADSVSELCNWLERAVEHTVSGIRVFVCNVDESAVTTFQEKTGKLIMEKCNMEILVCIKCEESSHYNSNCLLYHRCWLLCTSTGEHKAATACKGLKPGALPGVFYSTQRIAMSTKSIVLEAIEHYCTVNLYFPMLCVCSIDGNSVVHSQHPSAMDEPTAKFNKIFFRTAVDELYSRNFVP